ncbi:unnamed protein product [Natator depressus]
MLNAPRSDPGRWKPGELFALRTGCSPEGDCPRVLTGFIGSSSRALPGHSVTPGQQLLLGTGRVHAAVPWGTFAGRAGVAEEREPLGKGVSGSRAGWGPWHMGQSLRELGWGVFPLVVLPSLGTQVSRCPRAMLWNCSL